MDPAAPSPIDLRRLNEATAGEHGPLWPSADGNGLVTAGGTPFVAWMVHLPHGCDGDCTKDDWSYDDYRRIARLAMLLTNVIRKLIGPVGCTR